MLSPNSRFSRRIVFCCAKALSSLYVFALLGLVHGLAGCAGNPRHQSAEAIAQAVEHSEAAGPDGLAWFAPALKVSNYRILFYGYDTVYYRLAASERVKPDRSRFYRLLVYADYGGDVRHYDRVEFPDGSRRAILDSRHDVERCQFFNSLVYACLFRDWISVELGRSDLEKARIAGMRVILGSDARNYEAVDLPAAYVQGFLAAVD